MPLPSVTFDRRKPDHEERKPILEFKDIPIDWSDFRLMIRQTADILRRFETLESAGVRPHSGAGARRPDRSGRGELVRERDGAGAARRPIRKTHEKELLDQVLLLSMRPFLARCAEALLPRMEMGDWQQPCCPLCGGEPEFAYINPAAERLLICGRCTGQWRYDPITCPYCENSDRSAHHVVHQPRRPLPHLRLRRLPPLSEGLRRPRRQPAGDAGRGLDRHAPLDAAAIQRGYQILISPSRRRAQRRREFSCENLRLRLCVRREGLLGCGDSRSGEAERAVRSESHDSRWRVSQKRPRFELAPSTTTASDGPP